MDIYNETLKFPAGFLNGTGRNVLTVIMDSMGLEEDYNAMDLFKVRVSH